MSRYDLKATSKADRIRPVATDLDKATTALVRALQSTGSMSGTSSAAESWATSYDTRATSTIDNARRLAQSLPFFASLVALGGYNHELADYKADTNPHKGAAPTKPTILTAPMQLCWAGAPAAGGPGNGLVALAPLMDRIHVHIPDGDTDKLGAATKAWNDFTGTDVIGHGARHISDVAGALRQNQAHQVADLDDLVMTLSVSANKLYTSAKQLAADCDKHKQSLDQLRKQVKQAIDNLEAAIALTLVATIFADVITVGMGVIADAATLAAYGVYFDDAATAITGIVEAIDLDRILSVFAKEEDVAASIGRDLDEIDSLTPEEIEADETTGTSAESSVASNELGNLFKDGQVPKASQVEEYAQQQGWVKSQTENGPIKYTDKNGVIRVTIKKGSKRATGSENPYVEIRNDEGVRTDPFGNPVTRKSPGNHTPIDWDLP